MELPVFVSYRHVDGRLVRALQVELHNTETSQQCTLCSVSGLHDRHSRL